jgi:hypothetical protein
LLYSLFVLQTSIAGLLVCNEQFTEWLFVLGQPVNGPDRNTAVNKLASTFHLKADAGPLALRQETFSASTNLIGRHYGATKFQRSSLGDFCVL